MRKTEQVYIQHRATDQPDMVDLSWKNDTTRDNLTESTAEMTTNPWKNSRCEQINNTNAGKPHNSRQNCCGQARVALYFHVNVGRITLYGVFDTLKRKKNIFIASGKTV